MLAGFSPLSSRATILPAASPCSDALGARLRITPCSPCPPIWLIVGIFASRGRLHDRIEASFAAALTDMKHGVRLAGEDKLSGLIRPLDRPS